MSRTLRALVLPSNSPRTDGTVRTWSPASIAASMTRRIVPPDGFSRVINSIRAPVRRIASASWSRPPNTVSPATLLPRAVSSSSRNPTGRTPAIGSRRADRAIVAPTRPAPNSRVGVKATAVPSMTAQLPSSLPVRIANLRPPTRARLKTNSTSQKDSGSRAKLPSGMSARTIADPREIAVPTRIASVTWSRSGTLACRHSRRYKPKRMLTRGRIASGSARVGASGSRASTLIIPSRRTWTVRTIATTVSTASMSNRWRPRRLSTVTFSRWNSPWLSASAVPLPL